MEDWCPICGASDKTTCDCPEETVGGCLIVTIVFIVVLSCAVAYVL